MEDFIDIERQIDELCATRLSDDIREYNRAIQEKLTSWLKESKKQLESSDSSSPDRYFDVLNRIIEEYRTTFDLTPPEDWEQAPAYLQFIEHRTRDLPEEVVLEQDEGRFFPLPEDSSWIVLGKLIKRLGRIADRLGHSVRNGFRKIIGKPPEPRQPYRQHVPLQAVARFHLWNQEQAARQFSDVWNKVQLTLLADLEEFLVNNAPAPTAEHDELRAKLADFLDQKIDDVSQQYSRNEEQWQQNFEECKHVITQKARRTDTLEQPRSRYSSQQIDELREDTEAMIRRRSSDWIQAQRQVLKKLDGITDYFVYRQEVSETVKKLVGEIGQVKEELLVQPVSELIQKIKDAQQRIGEGAAASSFSQKRDELLTKMQENLLDPLSKTLEEDRFRRLIDGTVEKLLFRNNKLKEEIEIYYEARWQDFPPRAEVQVLPWQAIVTRRLNNELVNMLRQKKKEIREQLETYFDEFQEVHDVIRVNLDTSAGAEDSTDDPETSETVAVEGLQRAIVKLEADLEPIQQNQQELEELVQNKTETFNKQLWDLLTATGTGDFQLQDTSYRVRKKSSDLKKGLQSKTKYLQDKVSLFYRFGWGKTKKGYEQLSRFLGFKEPEIAQEQKADIATYLSETDRRLRELPFVYRKLFSTETDLDRSFFVSPKESFTKFQKSFGMWEEGFGATCAAIGEKGAGKTTFVDLALEEQETSYPTKRIDLVDTIWTEEHLLNTFADQVGVKATSIQELIDELNKGNRRKIIVLENLQNGYVRHINGYEAILNLLLLISETKESVFWFVSCSTYAWNLLGRVESAGEYFSHIIKVDTLDQQQIQTVIMRRHKVSGFELRFEADEETQASRGFRKLVDAEASAQEYLEERYFEKLARLSQGNASIAIIFWIRSIREFDETHFYIDPLEVASVEVIDELKPEVLFTLAALILHDTMTPEELAMAVNMDLRQSRLIFARLEAKGLLRESGEKYMLNHLMYRQVVNLLKHRNILHLL